MTVDLLWRPERASFRHVLDYRSDVTEAHDGTETRRAAGRTWPRQRLELDYYFDSVSQVHQIREDLLQNANATWRIPLWWDADVTTSEVTAAVDTWPLDPTYSNLAVGDVVYIEAPLGSPSGTFTVSQVNAGDIHTSAVAGGTYPQGTRIYPLKSCRLLDAIPMQRNRVSFERLKLVASYSTLEALGGTGAAATTYQASADATARQHLDKAPLGNDEVEYNWATGIERIDFGGAFSQFTAWGQSLNIERRSYSIRSRAELRYWELFLTNIVGMRDPFYTATYRDDLVLSEQPATGASVIKVNIDPPDYANQWWPNRYENLRLATDAGDIVREVLAVVDNGDGTANLTLSSALPATVAGSTINQISFLEHVRLAADTVTFQHDGLRSTVSLAIQNAPDVKEVTDTGDWELFDTVVVGAEGPVDTMQVSGLAGEAHVEYLVVYMIIKENVGTSNDVQIRLNGQTSNRASRLLQATTLYSQTSNKIANLGTAATYTAGEFRVSAAVNPHGSSVDWPKIYYGFGGQGSGSGVGTIAHAGGQDDNATALNTIAIVATDALSDTLNADIAEGSVMEVWRRVVI